MNKFIEKVSTLMCIYDFEVLIPHIKTDEKKCRIMTYYFPMSVEITPISRQDLRFFRNINTLRAQANKSKEKQTKITKSTKIPPKTPRPNIYLNEDDFKGVNDYCFES